MDMAMADMNKKEQDLDMTAGRKAIHYYPLIRVIFLEISSSTLVSQEN